MYRPGKHSSALHPPSLSELRRGWLFTVNDWQRVDYEQLRRIVLSFPISPTGWQRRSAGFFEELTGVRDKVSTADDGNSMHQAGTGHFQIVRKFP